MNRYINRYIDTKGLIGGIIVGDAIFTILGVFGIMSIHDTIVLLIWLPFVMLFLAATITIYDYCLEKIDRYKVIYDKYKDRHLKILSNLIENIYKT